jgi:RNA polymerase sigma factor (sigma-70 family)
MQLRRRRPEAATSIDERLHLDDEPLADRLPAPGPNPEEIYRQREQLQFLERVLRTLPAAYQHALRLCDVQGLKIREAAEITGTSTGTLKSQLWRARGRLRKQVAATRKTRRGAPQQSAAEELTREL